MAGVRGAPGRSTSVSLEVGRGGLNEGMSTHMSSAVSWGPGLQPFRPLLLRKATFGCLLGLAGFPRELQWSHLLVFLLGKGKPCKQPLPSFAGLTYVFSPPLL